MLGYAPTVFNEKGGLVGRLPHLYTPTKPVGILRSWQRAVLEVVLQDARRQCWSHASVWLDGTDDLSAADHFRSRQTCDLCGQYQIDFQLRIRLKSFVSLKEQSRTADVLGCADVPLCFAETAIA